MPHSKREEVAAVITLMVLLEGVFFDARKLSKLPYERSLVWRVMKALVATGVIVKVRKGKYIVADGFADMLGREVTWKMPAALWSRSPACASSTSPASAAGTRASWRSTSPG